VEQLRASSPERDEPNALLIQAIQVRVGRQPRVKDQFLRQSARAFLPETNEGENLVILLVLAEIAVGVAEETLLAVLGQKREDSLLPTASFGDVMLLDESVFAMKWDGVKVQIERPAMLQPQAREGIEPTFHQFGIAGWLDTTTMLGEERTLGHDIQAGEQGQSFIEHCAHDVQVPLGAEQLYGEQAP
jgi:hypothetical protein